MRAPFAVAVSIALLSAGCGGGSAPPARRPIVPGGARVGVDPIPAVHLFENHSSSLIVWRRAGLSDRVLVHLDGHSDVDWLPDATIAKIAEADPAELAGLALHPYRLDGTTHRRFAIWNWIYPAARLGIVRELIWVVPDGTLAGPAAAGDLVHELILDKIQSISLEESRTLRLENGTVRGTILGIPWTVCELKDLRDPGEPVLLDIDLDFFTTRSATSQEITPSPWIAPSEVAARLAAARIRSDVATLSFSTMGGYLPPACRWVGGAMMAALKRRADAADPRWSDDLAAGAAESTGDTGKAIRLERGIVAAHPDDAATWYALARALARAGAKDEAAAARARAVAADPVFEHATLFEADGAYMNGRFPDALDLYRAYLKELPDGRFVPYAMRREAGCLMRLGRDDDAIAAFRRVVELAPEHADTRLDLGVLLRSRGDIDGAVAQMRIARTILPELAACAMALGVTDARSGRTEAAISELEAAVARRPTWAAAQANLGALLASAGRREDAAAHLNAAAMLAPGDPDVVRLLDALRRQGIVPTSSPPHPD